MVAQPEHQLLAGAEGTECAADSGHGLALHAQERLGVVQPVANLHREDFAPVCGRRQGLTCKAPGVRQPLARNDEAIFDPLDSRGLATRSGTRQAAGGPNLLGVRGGVVGMCRSRSNTSRPWLLQTLLADRRAKAAEVVAEAPNGGFELRDAAQQDRGIEIGAHSQVQHMDARVGGTFRMSFHNFSSGNGHAFGGEYLELVPHTKIRYNDKFDDPNLPGAMEVTVLLTPVLCGTDLSVTQSGIPDLIPLEMCYLGWQESLAQLATLVEPEIPG